MSSLALSGLLLRSGRVSVGMEGNGVNNSTSPVSSDPKAANRARFELELEFIQALANPFYLHSLAQQNILEQPAFVNFLRYLLYFKEKEYARFIQYAHMLPLHVTIQTLIWTCLQKLSSRVASLRTSATPWIPISDEERRISQRVSSSKTIWPLAHLVRIAWFIRRMIWYRLLTYTPQQAGFICHCYIPPWCSRARGCWIGHNQTDTIAVILLCPWTRELYPPSSRDSARL